MAKRKLSGNFVALDFETADYGRDSACAVGLVRVEQGKIIDRESLLIRPPRNRFVFTYIHGITWPMVAGQPAFAEVWPRIESFIDGTDYLAAHNASFDKGVLSACCLSSGFSEPALPFECTVRLARKMWDIRPTRLPDVCNYLGISLNHHDAASDAEACAKIVIAALQDLGSI